VPQITCETNLVINTVPIASGIYQDQQSIVSAGTVVSDDTVIYHIGDHITLDPEFEVQLGAHFKALIDICT
jgi:hypothetical protein